jgi:protein-disulfide isomerase
MSKRRELIERRQAQQRKQAIIALAVIGAIAVLLIGGAIALNARDASTAASGPALVTATQPVPPNADNATRAWGPADAPIKVQEYLDYQCPACGNFASKYEQGVVDAFAKSGKVRWESRSMSFIGQDSVNAAKAALCAMDQGKFWDMHHTLFANQTMGENAGEYSNSRVKDMAAQIGLDTNTFNSCYDSTKYDDQITQDRDQGDKAGVQQTPTFVVNGKVYVGVQSATDFKRIFAEVAPEVKFE